MCNNMRYLVFMIFLIVLAGCKSEPVGPFFGNGFHNGWADQSSVVIWTRLTKVPEMNRSGPEFFSYRIPV